MRPFPHHGSKPPVMLREITPHDPDKGEVLPQVDQYSNSNFENGTDQNCSPKMMC